MIQQIRKKPVVIQAMQLTEDINNLLLIKGWCNAKSGADGSLKIETLEGIMTAFTGDWIIKGVNGEFYLCKPDIFEKTYDLVIKTMIEKENNIIKYSEKILEVAHYNFPLTHKKDTIIQIISALISEYTDQQTKHLTEQLAEKEKELSRMISKSETFDFTKWCISNGWDTSSWS